MPISSSSPATFWADTEGLPPGSSDSSRTGGVLVNWMDPSSSMHTSLSQNLTGPEKVKGDVEFKNVSFSYPTRQDVQVPQKFSLKIKAGSHVAIVGASGSGRSTVGALLSRSYDPYSSSVNIPSGSVYTDDVDISTLDPQWLRSSISVVPQEASLFGPSTLENTRCGGPGASMEEVFTVSKKASAHEFISSFPDGYNTLVGERGVQLSGGQRQRTAVAGALLEDAPLPLLDEATSALDEVCTSM